MPQRPDKALLARIADGEAAIHELAGVCLETLWGDSWEVSCPLCDELLPHSQRVHEILMPVRFLRLDRTKQRSKVKLAELAYRKATGGTLMRMEDILRIEMVEKQPPTSANVLGEIFGVDHTTVCRWAKRLGIPLQGPDGWWTKTLAPKE